MEGTILIPETGEAKSLIRSVDEEDDKCSKLGTSKNILNKSHKSHI
jgi:hypothetical protein